MGLEGCTHLKKVQIVLGSGPTEERASSLPVGVSVDRDGGGWVEGWVCAGAGGRRGEEGRGEGWEAYHAPASTMHWPG